MAHPELTFPDWFLWGAATAAHQVEGHNTHNDWWAWEQLPGRIRTGERSGIACDWWRRAEEDFDRARELGHNTHRLSIEWSRLEPRPGEWNEAAMARYRQMLEALHARGLTPMVTLYHFTLPAWFAEMGGWLHPQAVRLFARFAERVADGLGDLIPLWCTINEPMIYAFRSYMEGAWPPGRRSLPLALRVARTLLLAHGTAYRLLHARRSHIQVGLVKNTMAVEPARPTSFVDRQLAGFVDRLFNWLPLDAIVYGRFRPPLGAGFVSYLLDATDFIGINYYSRYLFGFDRRTPAASLSPRLHPDGERSDLNYGEIYPQGLYRILRRAARYSKPIYITENGLPDADDDQRPRFLLTHLAQIWRAMQEGVPVRGYYHWSLVDNFEWSEGYSMRFGLIEVDFATGERRVRPSGRLYAEIARTGTITPAMVARHAPRAERAVFGPWEPERPWKDAGP